MSKLVEERNREKVRKMALLPGNNVCMDCTKANPTFVCLQYKIFICDVCSDAHRKYGHSGVKPISFSTFSKDEVELLASGGNAEAEKIFYGGVRPDQVKPQQSKFKSLADFKTACEKHIERTYVQRAFTSGAANRSAKSEEEVLNTLREVSFGSKSQQPQNMPAVRARSHADDLQHYTMANSGNIVSDRNINGLKNTTVTTGYSTTTYQQASQPQQTPQRTMQQTQQQPQQQYSQQVQQQQQPRADYNRDANDLLNMFDTHSNTTGQSAYRNQTSPQQQYSQMGYQQQQQYQQQPQQQYYPPNQSYSQQPTQYQQYQQPTSQQQYYAPMYQQQQIPQQRPPSTQQQYYQTPAQPSYSQPLPQNNYQQAPMQQRQSLQQPQRMYAQQYQTPNAQQANTQQYPSSYQSSSLGESNPFDDVAPSSNYQQTTSTSNKDIASQMQRMSISQPTVTVQQPIRSNTQQPQASYQQQQQQQSTVQQNRIPTPPQQTNTAPQPPKLSPRSNFNTPPTTSTKPVTTSVQPQTMTTTKTTTSTTTVPKITADKQPLSVNNTSSTLKVSPRVSPRDTDITGRQRALSTGELAIKKVETITDTEFDEVHKRGKAGLDVDTFRTVTAQDNAHFKKVNANTFAPMKQTTDWQ